MTIKASCVWTIKRSSGGVYVPVLRSKNTLTNSGLSLLASAWGGGYVAPQYLVINTFCATLVASYAAGVSQVTLSQPVNQVNDTQIVLSIGTANQEVVTWTGVTINTDNSATYTLSTPTTKSHSLGDRATRQVLATDTITNIVAETQYDPINAPNQRIQAVSGISEGIGNWTVQFYIPGTDANVFIADAGLADASTINTGTLHNHVILGFDHTTQGNDLEIDVSLTLSN